MSVSCLDEQPGNFSVKFVIAWSDLVTISYHCQRGIKMNITDNHAGSMSDVVPKEQRETSPSTDSS